MLKKLSTIKNVKIVGPLNGKNRCGSVAFLYNGVHARCCANMDSEGLLFVPAIITMPLHTKFGWWQQRGQVLTCIQQNKEIDVFVQALQR